MNSVGDRIVDLFFQILALSVPLLLALIMASKARAVVLGTVWVWIIMVTACQYKLATDPNYDSFAPGIAWIAGWVPGLIYSTMCVLAAAVVKSLVRRVNTRPTPNR
jgi:hypothetical protein